MTLTSSDVIALEAMLAERLFEIARSMTAIGLEGEDPREPATASLIEEAFANASDVYGVKDYIIRKRQSSSS